MNLPALIDAIQARYAASGIRVNAPATATAIANAETKMRLLLPADVKEFYSICNGFDCADDKFSIVKAEELFRDDEYGWGCMIFTERMIYEVCGLAGTWRKAGTESSITTGTNFCLRNH